MTSARRSAVDKAFNTALSAGSTGSSHPGLLLDRGLREQGKGASSEETPGGQLLMSIANCTVGSLYEAAYRRWETALRARPLVYAAEMRTSTAMIVGLGGASVLETAITLSYSYGAPIIPGSALKGLARHYIRAIATDQGPNAITKQLDRAEYERVLFGTQASASYMVFHDAWYLPGSAPADRPLQNDIITVHHPDYYTKKSHSAPWDFDDPIPIPFLSARGHFLVAVEGPTAAWSRLALEILIRALAEEGAGGKTSSGYGRLLPTDHGINYPDPKPLPIHSLVPQIEALPHDKIAPQIGGYISQWRLMPEDGSKLQVARAIYAKGLMLGTKWLTARKWYDELRAYLDSHGTP